MLVKLLLLIVHLGSYCVCVLIPGHDKELAHHAAALPNVLLHQLTAGHSDEGAVCVVRHCPGQQRLAGPRRSIQQHPLQVQALIRLPCDS